MNKGRIEESRDMRSTKKKADKEEERICGVEGIDKEEKERRIRKI